MSGAGTKTDKAAALRAGKKDDVVIRVRSLVNGFGDKIIHDHIDLDVKRGEVLGVVGGSGAGKSVLLRSIVGLNHPLSGSIKVFGQETVGLAPDEMRGLQLHWGVLFQEGALFSSMTVAQNIQVPMRRWTNMSQSLMDELAAMKLSLVGLPEDAARKYPSELSGGMKKRAGLARALSLDPELLFLDEPTAGLDPISASQFDQLVGDLQKSLGLTVFMVTHDIDTLRATTDRIAVLVNKKIKVGTIKELLQDKDPGFTNISPARVDARRWTVEEEAMETKANYVAVGAFVLASVLGFVVALLWLAGAQYSAEYAYYRTYFSGAVTGLGDGTIVRYNGINVGHVSKLTFDPNDPKRVIVDLQVDPTLKIHSDSIASIASEGLTGGSYVEIDGGTNKTPVLKREVFGEYPVIQSKQSTLQQLEQSAPELIAKLSHVADRLNRALSDENIKNFSGILTNIKTTTDVFNARSKDIDKTLHNVSLASDTLNVDLQDLHQTLGNANVAVTKVSRLADDADSAVNGADLGQLSEQVRTLASSLTKLSNGLEREPTKLLFGDRRKGYTPQ